MTVAKQTTGRRRAQAVDGLLDRTAIAEALCCSYRHASRLLERSAVERSGLWPQLRHGGRTVVRASVVQAYIDALPCVEDAPTPPR